MPDNKKACFQNMSHHMGKPTICIGENKGADQLRAFVFATRIVQFLFYLNLKFQASSCLLCLYSLVCVGPVRKPHCWFSHEAAHICISGAPKFLQGRLMQHHTTHDKMIVLIGNLIVRKPDFCLCKNKGADQLRSNCEADQPLCFCYTDSTISLLLKTEISI